jgi:hypothetical protein
MAARHPRWDAASHAQVTAHPAEDDDPDAAPADAQPVTALIGAAALFLIPFVRVWST